MKIYSTLCFAVLLLVTSCTSTTTNNDIKKATEADAFIMQNKTGADTVYYSENKKQVRFAGELLKGKRNGLWKAYYPSGVLWSEGEYVNGSGEGLSHVFYANGSVKIMGFYTHDKPSGVWQFFDTTGIVTHEIDYTTEGKPKIIQQPSKQ